MAGRTRRVRAGGAARQAGMNPPRGRALRLELAWAACSRHACKAARTTPAAPQHAGARAATPAVTRCCHSTACWGLLSCPSTGLLPWTAGPSRQPSAALPSPPPLNHSPTPNTPPPPPRPHTPHMLSPRITYSPSTSCSTPLCRTQQAQHGRWHSRLSTRLVSELGAGAEAHAARRRALCVVLGCIRGQGACPRRAGTCQPCNDARLSAGQAEQGRGPRNSAHTKPSCGRGRVQLEPTLQDTEPPYLGAVHPLMALVKDEICGLVIAAQRALQGRHGDRRAGWGVQRSCSVAMVRSQAAAGQRCHCTWPAADARDGQAARAPLLSGHRS